MNTFQIQVSCYPWDLDDEGIDEVLDRLQGEAGGTGITVAAMHPGVDILRPHAGVSPRRFRSAGDLQFQPDRQGYRSTRVRPAVAPWLRKRNPLTRLADACEQRGLSLRFWGLGNHAPATVAQDDAHAVKDVFGQVNPGWLCPTNLDVREYLREIARDLSEHYGIAGLELVGIGFPSRLALSEPVIGFEPGPTGRWLLNLCFCESCRQMAIRDGVDVEAAARRVLEYVEKMLAAGEPIDRPVEDLLTDEPVLAAYDRWRRDQVNSLVQVIRGACDKTKLIVHRRTCPLWTGLEESAIQASCDGQLVPFADREVDTLAPAIEAAVADVGSVERVEVGLEVTTPPCPDAATLVSAMKRAVECGVRTIRVANYGLIPWSRLDWLHQAGRYARREASAGS